jgi:hypothetical protein
MEFVMILLVVGFVSFMFMGITYIIKHDKLVIINCAKADIQEWAIILSTQNK